MSQKCAEAMRRAGGGGGAETAEELSDRIGDDGAESDDAGVLVFCAEDDRGERSRGDAAAVRGGCGGDVCVGVFFCGAGESGGGGGKREGGGGGGSGGGGTRFRLTMRGR